MEPETTRRSFLQGGALTAAGAAIGVGAAAAVLQAGQLGGGGPADPLDDLVAGQAGLLTQPAQLGAEPATAQDRAWCGRRHGVLFPVDRRRTRR